MFDAAFSSTCRVPDSILRRLRDGLLMLRETEGLPPVPQVEVLMLPVWENWRHECVSKIVRVKKGKLCMFTKFQNIGILGEFPETWKKRNTSQVKDKAP